MNGKNLFQSNGIDREKRREPLPIRENRTLPQPGEPFHRVAHELLQASWRIFGRAVEEFHPLRLDADFFEQTSNGADADLRPVVSLSKGAFPPRTGYHADSSPSTLESV